MQVTIVNAYGRSNRGDSVLLDECIDELQTVFPRSRINCAVYEGMDRSKEAHPDIKWSERIGNSSAPGAMKKLHALLIIIISMIASVRGLSFISNFLPKPQKDTFEALKNSKIVVSAPGGYIHDTNFAFYIALFHIWLGNRFNAKVLLAPQSIGPIDGKFARWLSKIILSNTDIICARESYTYTFLKNELSLPSELIHRSGDSAFWNFDVNKDPAKVERELLNISSEISTDKKIFGITVVDWSFPKSANPKQASERYAKEMAVAIDHISSKFDLLPVIFNQVSEDLPMARRIKEYCKSSIIIDEQSREPDILRAMIAKSHVFLGTRFHSCIFAMMADVPVTAIAYLPKTTFILSDLNLSNRQISIDSVNAEAIISLIEQDLKDVYHARREIASAVSHYRTTHSRLSDFLQAYK